MKILVCNVGSTSLKYRLFDMADESSLAVGKMERVGSEMGSFSFSDIKGNSFDKTLSIPDYKTGIEFMIESLLSGGNGVINSLSELSCVGFKVVHAEKVSGVQLLNDEVLEAMERYRRVAPAHNPPYIGAIRQFKEILPDVPLIGSFETGFHQTMKPEAYLYSIPYEYYEKYGIRKYGFHGASHEYVSGRVTELLETKELKMISCHLGGTGSLCAIENGKSVDTTLGFSLQTGIMHNNRNGDIDPAVIFYMIDELGLSVEEVQTILSKKSGFLGMSGISNDVRDIEEAAKDGNERAEICIESYAYSIKKYIGAYAAAMNGLDVIAFTAGIGENDTEIRERVLSKLSFLGVKLDPEKNKVRGKEAIISADDSKVKVMVIPTNEEIIVARKAKQYLEGK